MTHKKQQRSEFTIQDDLLFDQQHIWHPYASMTQANPVNYVIAAQGVQLKLATGEELIDGMASWWAMIHGYNHPRLNQALHTQVDTFSHVMFGGLTHSPAIQLARTLLAMAPASMETVFFADSGSIAMEVAIKMAFQYQFARGLIKKNKLLTCHGGYHGDTFATMAVCDPINGMHNHFQGILPQHLFAPRPALRPTDIWTDDAMLPIRALFETHHESIAAFTIEPLVQGAGGMHFYHPNYLKGIRALCDEFDVLLIFDEIATGFGRTGRLFACEHADVEPDIMAVGKALTGGYMTLAATLARREIEATIAQGEANVLMHGPTFMANPLACAVALESLNMLQEGQWQEQVARIHHALIHALVDCQELPTVADVRVLGAIGVVEMKEHVDLKLAQAYFVNQGVWIRPFGKLIYIMPPYITTKAEIHQLGQAIFSWCSQLTSSKVK